MRYGGDAIGTYGGFPAGADLASPGPIGGTTPAAITGTTVVGAPINSGSNIYVFDSVANAKTSTYANATIGLDPNSGLLLASSKLIGWVSVGTFSGFTPDTSQARAGPNSIIYGAGTAATTTSRTEINKAVTAFTNAVAKATFTVTIPNAAHSAVIEFEFLGMLGAGGAINAQEAVASNTYKVVVTRTAGVNAVASVVSAAWGAVAANVAGATTATCTAAVSAIAGAVGATNTFTMDVTITRGGGSSDNHTALCYAKLLNSNAVGITIS